MVSVPRTLLLGFYGLLRAGELLSVCNHHVFATAPDKPAVVSLGLTKGGKRAGAAESISVTVGPVLAWLWEEDFDLAQPAHPSPTPVARQVQ